MDIGHTAYVCFLYVKWARFTAVADRRVNLLVGARAGLAGVNGER